MKNNSFFSRLVNDKRFLALVSLFLSFVVWLIVVSLIDPDSTQTVSGVVVDLGYNSSAYTSIGLGVIDQQQTTVTVTAKGDRSVIGGLDASDFVIYPNYSAVKGPGEYTLPLLCRPVSSFNNNYEIELSRSTITVRFDKMTSKKFKVSVDTDEISVPEGYYMEEPQITPGEITLKGPESEINKIGAIKANAVFAGERTESANTSAALELYNKEGELISSSETNIEMDTTQVEVTLTILKIKEVPLTFDFTGVPPGYDPAQLNATLSQKTLRVAGPPAQIDTLENISVGYINLTRIELGKPYDDLPELTVPEGLKVIEAVPKITVTFDTSGYTSRVVNVTEIRPINVPANMTLNFPVPRISNVVLVGTEEELEELATTSVIAQVDASNITLKKGQQDTQVQIIVSATKSVFAIGTYSVLCDVSTS